MGDLPPDVQPYKRTPTFTQDTVPAGLLDDHSTKSGVWGLIHVESGKLRYVVTDLRRCPADRVLSADNEPGVVEPTILHRVAPVGAVRFYVQFLKTTSGAEL